MLFSETWSSSPITISVLPAEILARIFHLAADTERCVHYDDESDEISPSMLLNSLPQVCSYWRQVSVNLCYLWSHIDLIDWGDPCDRLYDRARLWVERARDSPLDIHIYGRSSYKNPNFPELVAFLAPIIKQTCSLEIRGNASPRLIRATYGCWFNNGTPGSLKKIGLFDSWRIPSHSSKPLSISGVPDSSRPPTWAEQFEDFFLPVTVLRLRGDFPNLHSYAYHGLVELQLLSTMDQSSITRTQLMETLSSSPRLRTLAICIDIIHPTPNDALLLPVQLEDLEELGIIEVPHSSYGILLGMLAPGSKPLNMYLKLTSNNSTQHRAEIEAFFKRSKVVALCIKGNNVSDWFPLNLGSLPNLHTLLLDGQRDAMCCFLAVGSNTITTPLARLQLSNLYMSDCAVNTRALKNNVVSYPIHTLFFRRCYFVNTTRGDVTSLEEMKRFITEAHPHIKFLDGGDFERALRLWNFVS